MIAYFDIFSGISGDMVLGAFIDLGVPPEWLESQIKSNLLSDFKIRSETIKKNGLAAKNIIVEPLSNAKFRDYTHIKQLIFESGLSPIVKASILKAFEKIAKAESKIHDQNIDHIHFHEVGAIDSIVDIAGSFLSVEYLKINKIYSSKITLGSGFVKCSHGVIPIPAPATLAILKDVPIKTQDIKYNIDSKDNSKSELVTPTGAAIITTLTSDFGNFPEMIINKAGYGAGKNNTGSSIPNLLRIVLGQENESILEEKIYVVETTIDDMSQEYSGFIFEKLFKTGALDVCHMPVQMKKNRPGIRLEVLCNENDLKKIIHFIFKESTTTGIRYYKTSRITLKREIITIDTRFGKIKAKKILNQDNTSEILPEYEELKKIAEKNNIPLKRVYKEVNIDINAL